MSNRPRFAHTRFADADGTNVRYGYIASDDEMMTYGDMWEEYEELEDLEFLRRVVDMGDHQVDELTAYMCNDKKGAFINGGWYDYDEISDILIADGAPDVCRYCGGNCPNEPEGSTELCDGYAGDIDNLYADDEGGMNDGERASDGAGE